MNSFKSITRAIDYEVTRQIDVLEEGGKVEQESLRWDEVSGKTFPMRDKEDAQDYRYFPDPDLVAINLSEEYIENLKNTLPELPESRKERYINDSSLVIVISGLMLSPPRHAGRERLLRASQALAEALRLISDAHDPAAADAVLGVVAEQVEKRSCRDPRAVVIAFSTFEQGQHVVDGADGCWATACRWRS